MSFGRTRAVRSALLMGLAATLLALATQAAAAPGAAGTYTASISPNVGQAGSSSTFTVTISNSSSTAELKRVVINIPSGFTITSVGVPSPPSFTVARSGNEITLTGLLRPGSSLSLPINVTNPTTPAGYTFGARASGSGGTFTNTGPALRVTIAQAAAVAACDPNLPCSTPTLSAGATRKFLATDSQVTAQAGPKADLLSVVLPDPTAAQMLCQRDDGTFGQIVTWSVTSRTSTLVYTVHPTMIGYTYDLSDTCFGSTQPFPGAVQNSANQNEFEGTLPYCNGSSEQTNPPPCVVSIITVQQETGPPAVQVTVNAPLGDPKFSG